MGGRPAQGPGPVGERLRRTFWSSLLLPIVLLLLASCNAKVPVDVGTSTARGIVRRVDYVNHMVTLDHDTVPHLLAPMTFAYPVRSDSLMNGIHPGDSVTFTLSESSPGNFQVETLKPIVDVVSRTTKDTVVNGKKGKVTRTVTRPKHE